MTRKKKYAKKRREFLKKLVYGLISFSLILLMHHALSSFFYESNTGVSHFSGLKAAVVDHLSLTIPNQTFVETATKILEQAGFTVDYYLGKEVTVEFYRNLPTHSYGLILLRVHSTAALRQGEEYVEGPVALFTSEPYSTTKYVYEQLTDQIGSVGYLSGDDQSRYFGITPAFIESSNGRFQSSTVIMMGCDGLTNAEMAEAFLNKGAKVYIGWNGPVSASHTDYSTIHLLQRLLIRRQTIDKALEETFLEIGPDPAYKSLLIYYPIGAGDYTIQSPTIQESSIILDRIEIKIQEKLSR